MGELLIILIIFTLIAVALQVALYRLEDDNKFFNAIFGANVLYSIIMSMVYWSSLPTNWQTSRTIAIGFGLVGICAIFIRIFGMKTNLAKAFLSMSIIASLMSIIFI